MNIRHNQILGLKISDVSVTELNAYIYSSCKSGYKKIVPNLNIHCINLAHRYSWLKNFLNSCELVFCGGDGVRIGAGLLGVNIREKITYNRWIWTFARFCETNNISWYIIGSKQDVIEKAAENLHAQFPELNILGFHNGYFNDEEDLSETIAEINEKKPHVLILGMGMPLQEKWLNENFNKLDINVALTGGAVFDYVAGNARMTPDIFFRLKLEWLYRFLWEPKRLFRRYFIGNPLFFFRILLEKFHIKQF